MQQFCDQQAGPATLQSATAAAVTAPGVRFEERRQQAMPSIGDRRQFSDSRTATRPEVAELGAAVDRYKLVHRRRFITFEELHDVLTSLGYSK